MAPSALLLSCVLLGAVLVVASAASARGAAAPTVSGSRRAAPGVTATPRVPLLAALGRSAAGTVQRGREAEVSPPYYPPEPEFCYDECPFLEHTLEPVVFKKNKLELAYSEVSNSEAYSDAVSDSVAASASSAIQRTVADAAADNEAASYSAHFLDKFAAEWEEADVPKKVKGYAEKHGMDPEYSDEYSYGFMDLIFRQGKDKDGVSKKAYAKAFNDVTTWAMAQAAVSAAAELEAFVASSASTTAYAQLHSKIDTYFRNEGYIVGKGDVAIGTCHACVCCCAMKHQYATDKYEHCVEKCGLLVRTQEIPGMYSDKESTAKFGKTANKIYTCKDMYKAYGYGRLDRHAVCTLPHREDAKKGRSVVTASAGDSSLDFLAAGRTRSDKGEEDSVHPVPNGKCFHCPHMAHTLTPAVYKKTDFALGFKAATSADVNVDGIADAVAVAVAEAAVEAAATSAAAAYANAFSEVFIAAFNDRYGADYVSGVAEALALAKGLSEKEAKKLAGDIYDDVYKATKKKGIPGNSVVDLAIAQAMSDTSAALEVRTYADIYESIAADTFDAAHATVLEKMKKATSFHFEDSSYLLGDGDITVHTCNACICCCSEQYGHGTYEYKTCVTACAWMSNSKLPAQVSYSAGRAIYKADETIITCNDIYKAHKRGYIDENTKCKIS